eukprot:TRINITY_DN138_c0_g1_i1.p1 TRINITY_DN138_c0_g1~~TRINITY_DN138_c0_g1_i1.p1  ORF type:complete len:193 (+),score=41.65 TRINITY_DN138_c0_g1_i1:186-764(+)
MSLDYRIVIVGAGGVGKSALTVRFIQGNFIVKYDPTIEDSYRKQVEVDGKACMLDIMDTAGQEEYSALRDQYMKTGEGFVLVYSVISMPSFQSADKLHQNILRIKEEYPDIPILLVGNKVDCESERQVTSDQGREYAARKKLGFIETSAKANKNVNELFYDLVHRINEWRAAHPSKSDDLRGLKKKSICVML